MTALIVLAVLACLFFMCIICFRKSLKLAIDTIDASADFLNGTKRIILVNILYFFLTIILFLVWIGATACVVSLNDIEVDKTIPQGKKIIWNDKKNVYMALYMLFGFLWIQAWFEYTC